MSLINQMLRDLQARQQGASVSTSSPAPLAVDVPRWPLRGGFAAGAVLAVLLLWWLSGQVASWVSAPDDNASVVVVTESPQRVAPQPAKSLEATTDETIVLSPEVLPGGVSTQAHPGTARGVYLSADEAFAAAQVFYRTNREPSALAALQLSLELDPRHIEAREFLADFYEMTGRFEAAVDVLMAGVSFSPDHLAFRLRAARLLDAQGKTADAAQVLLRSGLPRVSQSPEIHALLADYYLRLNEPFLAAQTYRNLLTAWPKTGVFWVGLGRALEEQDLPKEAARAYRQALAAGDLSEELSRFALSRLGK